MAQFIIAQDEAETKTIDELFQKLESSKEGLSSAEAKKRLLQCGQNTIEEKKTPLFLKILHYFWGPIPWMIEIAAILSGLLEQWDDFGIIIVLLLVNGCVGFFQEYSAGNAIEALKKHLALKSLVKRDGKWQEINSIQLVPGDLIRLRLGNIIPADAKLLEGDYLSVDQSTLTGESLPVSKRVGDIVFSGSIAKQGEMLALAVATGQNTFFGKTAKLVEKAKPVSHFQRAVFQIGRYLIYISVSLAILLIIIQFARGNSILSLTQFALVLIVASIPVALPAVLSVTMALGALKLSKMKAVVAKLESIEEMAGIDVLCCDKTGTLTQNKLTLGIPIASKNIEKDTVVFYGALASKEENRDPIDLAIIHGIKDSSSLKGYIQTSFVPFDPVSKKTQAALQDPQGKTFFATKGAPQVILALCSLDKTLVSEMNMAIDSLSKKGYRTLGVARSSDGKAWEFLGLLPLFDPLRKDSKTTIARAIQHGTQVKMLTGDNIAIAKEIGRELELGEDIYIADELPEIKGKVGKAVIEKIEKCNGFAQVFPEHKYNIIKLLQKRKHIVSMTGDGVNDAPALKQADVGIAVSGATDAARSAASLILLAPGLSVIIKAIEEARRIFARMTSYSIYRIGETIRLMFFIVTCIFVYNFYPVTALMIILLALLNDIPILTIAYDNTLLDKKPVRWQMQRVLTIATALGITGVFSSFLLLVLAQCYFLLTLEQLQSLLFLKLSIAGHQMLFVARTKHAFFMRPFPSPILFSAIIGTQAIAAMIVGFGFLLAAIPWPYIGLLWLYCLVWMFIADVVKIFCYRLLDKRLKKTSI